MKLGVVVLFAMVAGLMGLPGCESLVDTPGENFTRVAHAVDDNGKQIPIDTERLLLIYKPSQLSAEAIPTQ